MLVYIQPYVVDPRRSLLSRIFEFENKIVKGGILGLSGENEGRIFRFHCRSFVLIISVQ